MRIIKPGYEFIGFPEDPKEIYRKIERAGRTCYKSEDKITDESAEKFVRALVKNHHEAMLEHASFSVVFTVDRGVSHELVRHRLAAFAQESTRYCSYNKGKFSKEITVIEPCFYDAIPEKEKKMCQKALNLMDPKDHQITDFLENTVTDLHRRYAMWYDACVSAENEYMMMLDLGATPQEARDVLPNSLKTDIVVTADAREWRHILNLRAAGTTGKPHPQMAEVMTKLLKELQEKLPALFEDIKLPEE